MELDLFVQGVPSSPPLEILVLDYCRYFHLDPQAVWDKMDEHWWGTWMAYRKSLQDHSD